MISTGELKKGITIELDGQLYSVLEYQHIKVGRGSAQVRLRLRDVKAGHNIERTFQAGDKFKRVRLERRQMQYLYKDEDLYHFMDTETYDQLALRAELLADAISYLKENMLIDVLSYGEEPIGVELPIAVELKITYTEPGFRGDTATGGGKPATLETGLQIQVPFFVNEGDVIKVDTRNGSYLERVN